MTQFMERDGVVWLDRCERTDRRQVDEVERRNEARLIAAVPNVGFGRHNESVDRGVALGLGRKRRFGDGEVIDLRDVEDRVLAQHRSLLELVVVTFADDGLGEHHVRAVLALAHMRTAILRLIEGHPRVRGIAVAIGARPEDRNIDAAVGSAGDRVGRHDTAGVVTIGFPRAHPGNCATLHFLNDGAGDALVNPHLLSPEQSKRGMRFERCGRGDFRSDTLQR